MRNFSQSLRPISPWSAMPPDAHALLRIVEPALAVEHVAESESGRCSAASCTGWGSAGARRAGCCCPRYSRPTGGRRRRSIGSNSTVPRAAQMSLL